MTFDEWFHKEYEPADLQIKQYAERKEVLHIPATVYLEDLKKAFEAGQKDSEAQIKEMKCCGNCAKRGHICVAEEVQGKLCGKNKDKWELRR